MTNLHFHLCFLYNGVDIHLDFPFHLCVPQNKADFYLLKKIDVLFELVNDIPFTDFGVVELVNLVGLFNDIPFTDFGVVELVNLVGVLFGLFNDIPFTDFGVVGLVNGIPFTDFVVVGLFNGAGGFGFPLNIFFSRVKKPPPRLTFFFKRRVRI